MATPEVRVRLSAEGVAEVVGAFRRIGNEVAATGKKSTVALDPLEKSLNSIRGLLPALSVAAGASILGRLTTDALANADALSEVAQRLGITTKFLQEMNYVAVQSGTDVGLMEQALIYLSKRIGQTAAAGEPLITFIDGTTIASQEADGAVRGLEAVFYDILRVFPRIQSGAAQVAAGAELFGARLGGRFINSLTVGVDGMRALAEEAQRSGHILENEFVQAGGKVNDQLELISDGARKAFARGLIAGFGDEWEDLNEVAGDSVLGKRMEQLGKLVALLGNFSIRYAPEIITAFGAISAGLAGLLAFGPVGGFLSAIAGGLGAAALTPTDQPTAAPRRRLPAHGASTTPLSGHGGGPIIEGTITGIADPAVASARLAAAKAALETEARLLQANLKLQDAINDSAFKAGEKSASDYYAEKRRIITEGLASEVGLLEKQRAEIAGASTKDAAEGVKRSQEIAKIDGEIAQKKIDSQAALVALTREESEARLDLADKLAQFEGGLAATAEERHAAAIAGIEQEIEAYDRLLIAAGATQEQRDAALADARAIMSARADFAAVEERASQAQQANAAALADIRRDEASGAISTTEATKRILALEQDRLPLLRELAAELARIAALSNDPALVQAAEDFNQSVEDTAVATDRTAQEVAALREGFAQQGEASISTFFEDIMTGAQTADEAFRNFTKSILSSFSKLVADLIAKQLALKVFGGLFSGLSGAAAGATGFEEGGYTGDFGTSEPAGVVHGREFVVRAPVVARPGVREYLERLNAGAGAMIARSRSLPGFAGGGFVQPADSGAGLSGRPFVAQVTPDVMGLTLAEWLSGHLASEAYRS